MRIGQFARLAGVSASAIRFYEKCGLMPPPQRHSNGYRSYGEDDLYVIRLIAEARALGFSLVDVGRFIRRPPAERRNKQRLLPILERKLALLDQHLDAIAKQQAAIRAFIDRIGHIERSR